MDWETKRSQMITILTQYENNEKIVMKHIFSYYRKRLQSRKPLKQKYLDHIIQWLVHDTKSSARELNAYFHDLTLKKSEVDSQEANNLEDYYE